MKKIPTLYLKFIITLSGFATLAVSSHIIYEFFKNEARLFFLPMVLVAGTTLIPFFFGLYQAFKLLRHIEKKQTFSRASLKALQTIKVCTLIISGIYTVGLPFLFRIADLDDAPGVLAFSLIFIFASVIIATFTAVLQKLVQSGINLQAENDLTI